MPTRRLVQVGVHLVWATKYRVPWLTGPVREQLDGLFRRALIRRGCEPFAIGGWIDHMHLYTSLSPTMTLSSLVGALKANSARWVREHVAGLDCFEWQRGYAAFGVDPRDDAALREYVRAQEGIHSRRSTAVAITAGSPHRRKG